jgi:hypothetical protein
MSSISAGTTLGTGLVSTGDTTGELVLKTNGGTTAVTIGTDQSVTFAAGVVTTSPTVLPAGTVSAPALTTTGDTNTGIFFPAADTIAFAEGGAEAMRIDSSGRLLLGTTTAPSSSDVSQVIAKAGNAFLQLTKTSATAGGVAIGTTGNDCVFYTHSGTVGSETYTERARITSGGDLLVGKSTTGLTGTAGVNIEPSGRTFIEVTASLIPFYINRQNDDGGLIEFRQGNAAEGSISVSGTTVSYNGGHLSRWAQTTTAKDESLKKGTVLSNLDEMNVYVDADGNPVENEQLNKVKVSDVEGDANVAGVFVNWDYDEAHQVDEINMAMTGDMIIRIAQGTTVARGDLLMSAGDGTAKPQGDDIVRSKTIAKVTSTHVTCTYDDGSYCVPCVLMAC